MKNIFLVAVGGALGAASRYLTTLVVIELAGERVIFTAIFIENIAGCLLIGILFAGIRKRNWFSPELRLLTLAGFTGSYTTYSGFGIEAFHLFGGSAITSLIYVFVQIATGILAVGAGMAIVLLLFPEE